LHICCQNGDIKSVNLILDYCAQSTTANETEFRNFLYLKNKQGLTALDIARGFAKTEAPREEIFELLQAKY